MAVALPSSTCKGAFSRACDKGQGTSAGGKVARLIHHLNGIRTLTKLQLSGIQGVSAPPVSVWNRHY
ncbi:Hypothetical protein GbCGDNIH8_8571 [Granulibacter bethesdensis]|nr:Hypothetical protein GbCGDNIH8_8571 [Granulibacter bethesdensis]